MEFHNFMITAKEANEKTYENIIVNNEKLKKLIEKTNSDIEESIKKGNFSFTIYLNTDMPEWIDENETMYLEKYYREFGFQFEDFIQEGNCGSYKSKTITISWKAVK